MDDLVELFCVEFGYFCYYYTRQSPVLTGFLILTTLVIYLALKGEVF